MFSKSSPTSERAESLGIRPYIQPIVKRTLIQRSIRKRTVEDLTDDCLKLVFRQMTLKQKFAVERVSRRWKSLVNEELKSQTGFIVGSNPVGLHRWIQVNQCSDAYESHHSKDEIEDTEKVWLQLIAIKCPNIKCIVFRIDMNEEYIEWIQKQFVRLECIFLNQYSHPFTNRIIINDGFKIANLLSRTLRHLSINCKNISGECLMNLTSNLPLLEELEIIKFGESLEHIFERLREGIKAVSLFECKGFRENAINALSRRNNSSITGLRISRQYDLDRHLSLICRSFPNLKDLEIGFIIANNIRIANLVLLSQLNHLLINFYNSNPYNWAQSMPSILSLKSFHIICGQLNGPVLISMLRVIPNIEKLDIEFPQIAFRCTCQRNQVMGCEECFVETYTQLSKFEHLRQIRFNGAAYFTREYVIRHLKRCVGVMPALNSNAFPSLQWIQIRWKLFPRPFKRPLFDGLAFLAKRNPSRVIILETGIGVCRCHNSKLKSGWFSAIGPRRLSKIPPNLKLMFFRDIPL